MVDGDVGEPFARPGDFTGKWDPDVIRALLTKLGPIVKRWFRSEVRGFDRLPPGGALIVSNHSGGPMPMDAPVLAMEFFDKFGYDRPLYTLANDVLFNQPLANAFVRAGMLRASRDNAAKALRSGAAVIVFPGGDYDAFRPTSSANVIDFGNRKGYVRTALDAGVPIVPVVSIGGQENQLYLSRGEWMVKLAKWVGLTRLLRMKFIPITIGIPFGPVGPLPLMVPLPTKIVTEVLEPVDIVARFGDAPDASEVDAHVRKLMQSALDRLASERRFPVLG